MGKRKNPLKHKLGWVADELGLDIAKLLQAGAEKQIHIAHRVEIDAITHQMLPVSPELLDHLSIYPPHKNLNEEERLTKDLSKVVPKRYIEHPRAIYSDTSPFFEIVPNAQMVTFPIEYKVDIKIFTMPEEVLYIDDQTLKKLKRKISKSPFVSGPNLVIPIPFTKYLLYGSKQLILTTRLSKIVKFLIENPSSTAKQIFDGIGENNNAKMSAAFKRFNDKYPIKIEEFIINDGPVSQPETRYSMNEMLFSKKAS